MDRSYHVKSRFKLPDGRVMAFRNRSPAAAMVILDIITSSPRGSAT